MNREILFRGKRIDNGEWVEGFYWKSMIKNAEYIIIGNIADMQMYPVIPETVGQFTGLTDKTGKRIFEGDIVKVFDSVINEFVNVECFYWNEFCQFTFKNTYEDLSFLNNESIEIIGTIHDKTEQP